MEWRSELSVSVYWHSGAGPGDPNASGFAERPAGLLAWCVGFTGDYVEYRGSGHEGRDEVR
jgi:hypothetical protein